LIGMRERVAAHGGQLTVGPVSGGGFAVCVKLPIPDGVL
jgi:signal transduction histidine kinase